MSMTVKAQAVAYAKVLSQLEGTLSRTTEGLLHAGHLIHKARELGIEWEQLSADIGVRPTVLQSWEKTSLFWGKDRIEGCKSYHHYRNCDTEKEKAFLTENGVAGCKQRYREEAAKWEAAAAERRVKQREEEKRNSLPAERVHRARNSLDWGVKWIRDSVAQLVDVKRLNAAEKARVVSKIEELCVHLQGQGIDVAVVQSGARIRRVAS